MSFDEQKIMDNAYTFMNAMSELGIDIGNFED